MLQYIGRYPHIPWIWYYGSCKYILFYWLSTKKWLPRCFRAHPSLLQNKEYITLINNLILQTILDDIKDQNDPNVINWRNILLDKEAFEQKRKYLLYMEQTHNWQVKETLLQIEADLLVLVDFLPTTEDITWIFH